MNVDLEALPIGEDAPEVVNVVVEVPVASRNKYEYEPEMGAVMLDRVLPGNVRYPADYGFIPSTISTDDSPMDIFVASFDPVFPGCVIRARILGALDTLTSEGSEPNIFAVPHHDARFDDMSTLEDVPEQLLNDVESFFVTYMQLEGNGEAEVQSWHDQEETYEIIREGSRAYQEDRAYQREA